MRGLQIQFLHYIHILAQPARALLQSSTYRILILSQKPQFSIYHPRHKLQCINKFYLLLSIRLDQTAVHPFRAGVPQAAETQSGRTAPRGRRRTVHPMRPLCRTLSHAGDRARRRTAHRPGALHPLLCMRQRLRVRRTHVRNAFRCRSVAQLRPAETARNAYVI